MSRFFVDSSGIADGQICLSGPEVNHIRQVLRMRPGDEITLCDGAGTDYQCRILAFSDAGMSAEILRREECEQELPVRITLYQGLPKKDKMELIVQKAVELGASRIVPVMMKRTIVKLDDAKKEAKKLERWNAIAKGAAEQSGRGIVPEVCPVMAYADAVKEAAAMEAAILPYECAEGMRRTAEAVKEAAGKKSLGVLIGPEGGFEEEEVILAEQAGIVPVTLGKRILRTETAGLCILSLVMAEAELYEEERKQSGSISG
ncbi:MAG: 16S rRNA (uracil(1498)-N(3))-methyltransferase [Lachnospiraceae bacterium]|nr:16S rRNA (uracil(1498)-N(3))-methyltransferase [Lachnospiraceae bacterium]MBQ9562244.1 16S rRNA (uracil(1498)-N(3))-methyltransferase [Lachnospiraceae bacterium]